MVTFSIPRRTPEPKIASQEQSFEVNSARRTNELSEDPAQVDVCRQIWPQANRGDFGSIGCSDCLKHSPRQSTEDFSCQQHLDVDSEESNEDEADLKIVRATTGDVVTVTYHKNQGESDSEAVSHAFSHYTASLLVSVSNP